MINKCRRGVKFDQNSLNKIFCYVKILGLNKRNLGFFLVEKFLVEKNSDL